MIFITNEKQYLLLDQISNKASPLATISTAKPFRIISTPEVAFQILWILKPWMTLIFKTGKTSKKKKKKS